MTTHALQDPASLPGDARVCIERAVAAREKAYCPYSKFQVGAALITKKGTVYTGCNVENASSGMTICAERTAIVKAVSEGETDFCALAVCAESNKDGKFVSPCGACRQVIAEFTSAKDIPVYLKSPSQLDVLATSSEKLLPLGFNKEDL